MGKALAASLGGIVLTEGQGYPSLPLASAALMLVALGTAFVMRKMERSQAWAL